MPVVQRWSPRETARRCCRQPVDATVWDGYVHGMIWASRTFPRDGWYDVQAHFEDEYDAAGSPADRLLCRAESAGRTTIYV